MQPYAKNDRIPGKKTKSIPLPAEAQGIPSFKHGGIVKKTGLAYVHKGEKIIPKNKVKK